MSYFGEDSFGITVELRKLLTENDPLQQTDFFPHLAVDLMDVRDAEGFDAAYESAVEVSGFDEASLPTHFDRRILLALCSNPKLLEDWARRHYSVTPLSKLGLMASIRFVFWNRYLWPVELPVYVVLFLSFGVGVFNTVLHIDLTQQAILLGGIFITLYLVALMAFAGMLIVGTTLWLFSKPVLDFAVATDKLWDRSRWNSIERKRTRDAKRQAAQESKA